MDDLENLDFNDDELNSFWSLVKSLKPDQIEFLIKLINSLNSFGYKISFNALVEFLIMLLKCNGKEPLGWMNCYETTFNEI